MILLDTSGMLAALDRAEPMHVPALRVLEPDPGPLVLSPFVLGELDYLLATRVGMRAELALLAEVAAGRYELAAFDQSDVAAARAVVASHRDLDIGLTDASIVVLAGKFRTNRVLTLDERHFRALRTPDRKPFELLPADA